MYRKHVPHLICAFTTTIYFKTLKIPPSFFKDAELISVLPLDAKEIAIYRPDLPLRVCRNKFLTWNENHFETLNESNSHLSLHYVFYTSEIILPVTEIALQPFGPKRGTVKSTIIKSMDEKGFTFNELIWNAHTIQRIHIRESERAGVGIYRSGHQKKMPSFYIGGYYDAANFLPKED